MFTEDIYRRVRLACPEGMSQREAARHFNISRDSVAKMMAFSVPPGYRRSTPVKRPMLDGFTGIIDGWLDCDREIHRKQRHTAKRVFERLRDEHGFTGGYTCGNASVAAARCSCLWRIRPAMPKLTSAKPLSLSTASSRRRISSSWICRTAMAGVCVILCPDAFSYAMGKRSSNMMASWLLTRCHSRTDRFHSAEVALSAK